MLMDYSWTNIVRWRHYYVDWIQVTEMTKVTEEFVKKKTREFTLETVFDLSLEGLGNAYSFFFIYK